MLMTTSTITAPDALHHALNALDDALTASTDDQCDDALADLRIAFDALSTAINSDDSDIRRMHLMLNKISDIISNQT